MQKRRIISAVIQAAAVFGATAVFANPISPTQYVVLSEVQIIDPTHWTVEFLYSNKFNAVTLLSDTFTYDFSLVNKSIDTSYHPKIPIKKNGYGLITPQQYPTLQLHPGDTVTLQWNHFGSFNWECIIDRRLQPTQSMAAYQGFYQGGYGTYASVLWCLDATPTLGYANDSTGIYGCLKGLVCDGDSIPIPNFQLAYYNPFPGLLNGMQMSIKTDTNGRFFWPNLVSSYKFSFFSSKYGGNFGPFSVVPECTLSVVCKFDDYIATASNNPVFRSTPSSIKIVGVTKTNAGALIVFNGGDATGDYTIDIFSLNGKRMHSTTVFNSGPGTYSVSWYNAPPSGTYVARIQSPSSSIEKRFSIR
ncbi:MAG TPA: T9SS type A sorting domain-containing protein [Chitinivibrionales bacterium]|nr:T9SS type A sorting domain-containing protein [Chitinivibrionales bacterium]